MLAAPLLNLEAVLLGFGGPHGSSGRRHEFGRWPHSRWREGGPYDVIRL